MQRMVLPATHLLVRTHPAAPRRLILLQNQHCQLVGWESTARHRIHLLPLGSPSVTVRALFNTCQSPKHPHFEITSHPRQCRAFRKPDDDK